MYEANCIYHHGAEELHGFLAFDDQITTPRPAVIVAHDWTGRNDFACQKAKMLAEMGYIGFALDMYGQGRLGVTNEEKMALMQPLVGDRALLRERLLAAYHAVAARPEVDKSRIAVIGFCFGGLCALDLARSGADLRGVVTFHGILNKPEHLESEHIKAKILVLHGYDDPMVKPEQVHAFCQEMTEAKVDWQVHMYGHVQHAFTNPQAHDASLGLVFDSLAEQRSLLAMRHFLHEIF
ncbi:dienelactone hydrolase family transporter protein [Legionella moravica]|uniref:Carboxymethylenebutenolidase n=1 Tax=Legionella moravica TaxID=39962 RepID=A0A378K3J5_9GAMM|nr:dienelactone hydrolase family protein [Legionella moravica]KTD34906.1 dienelactone hydrolase family transporter protein [Legionella moravica]STX63849.1 carboxymethylenebutenolidase [Legionella moravica]